MKPLGVLIISCHPLFAEAITHLLEEGGVHQVTTVDTIPNALSLLKHQTIKTVIVDYDEPQLRDTEVVSSLVENDQAYQVIFLTMSDNQMIVHHRERVENV
ncbi:MAG: response regulator, partial [Chloroflexota bacterium]